MNTSIISRVATGALMLSFAAVIALSAPQHADAYYGGYYNSSYQYPPAPSYYSIPTVQVVYANGYYQNYYVPTVRYFPATHPVPVPTTYYPSQPPVYTQGGNNFPGSYGNHGGYRNW